MSTVVLQILLALLVLAFGLSALFVARHRASLPEPSASVWILSGAIFSVEGVSAVVQTVWAAWAFQAGPSTAVYDSYLAWAAAGNYGRMFLHIGYALLLLGLIGLRLTAGRRFWITAAAGLLLLLATGTIVGVLERPFNYANHTTSLAVANLAVLAVLLIALLRSLTNDAIDKLLWTALVVYALRQVLQILWVAASIQYGAAGTWVPSVNILLLISITAQAGMLACAIRRLVLARRGTFVPGFYEHLQPLKVRPM